MIEPNPPQGRIAWPRLARCRMDWDDALPWALLLFIAPFVLSIRSIVADRRLKAEIEVLTGKIGMLDHRIFRLDEQLRALTGGTVAPPPPAEEPLAAGVEAPPVEPP